MIEIHLLRYALAAAESGSFSQAAARFRIKQSTLSKHISYLEQRLGLSLFTRSTQGVQPTPSGITFLARARSIIGHLDDLSTESRALARGELGRLRLGFQGSLASGDLHAIVEEFRGDAPLVEIEAIEAGSARLLNGLATSQLDIAVLAGEAEAASLQSMALWSDPVCAALPHGHALLERDRLYWTDLRDKRFLVTRADPGDHIAAIITARLSGPICVPSIARQAVSRSNLPSFASETCVPILTGTAPPPGGRMVMRPIHDAFGPTRLDQSAHWRSHNDSPALKRFLALLGRRYGRPLA